MQMLPAVSANERVVCSVRDVS